MKRFLGRYFKSVPFLGYLVAFLVCVVWENLAGQTLADLLGMPKIPVLFGLVTIFKAIAAIVDAVFKDAAFSAICAQFGPRSRARCGSCRRKRQAAGRAARRSA